MSVVNQIRSTFMSRYGLTDDILHKGTITTSGTTYISADPALPSVVKPVYVTINSVDEFKEFGGNPDHLYTSGVMQEHHNVADDWPAAKTSLAYSELSPHEKAAICHAYTAYIYGNSQKVQSYRDVIQKHYFPAQLAVLAAEDVVVKSGDQLILSGDGDAPITYSFNTITVEAGGQIINTGQATLLANVLTQQGGDSSTYTYVSLGTDAKDGAAGGNGGNGSSGTTGSSGSDGKDSCDTKPGQGGTGGTGNPGSPGGSGSRGSDAAPVNATLDTVDGPVTLGSVGGNGGNGGTGGQGGTGGTGGPGGASTSHCSAGAQGKGGTGGDGGNGGTGGDGGSGQSVYFNYTTLVTGGSITVVTPEGKGQGGQGGKGGNAGNGGSGNPQGGGGHAGQAGVNGTNGKLGTVYVNNVPQPPSQ
ncbi:hypothetical protein MH117_17870 [Paenibacillus sp. ACRRX]|uniref:hypothetical protein n=1 Tax=Paenibacillus sp. ACRRX TaxID=2918206 RepID=UPI001EF61A97|nr:hypothetical protein [Paenibacillus sp. ACRRX]MCG7409289.1 hypothetical protein [Paenibacillus sp. ACRRX]